MRDPGLLAHEIYCGLTYQLLCLEDWGSGLFHTLVNSLSTVSLTHTLNQSIVYTRLCTGPGRMRGSQECMGLGASLPRLPCEGDQNRTQM